MNKKDISLILFIAISLVNLFAYTSQNGWLLLVSYGLLAVNQLLFL